MHCPRGLLLAELADRLEERQALDVADGAADLAEHEVDLVLADAEEVLDLVGDVRDHLDGLAEVVAAALLLEHVGIDPPGRDRIRPPRRHAGEALVVAEVEVGLRAVVGDEDLAVLERRHGAGIDVEVGVELAQPHRIAARLQQRPERRRRETLAERRDHAARDEDVPRHRLLLPCPGRYVLRKPRLHGTQSIREPRARGKAPPRNILWLRRRRATRSCPGRAAGYWTGGGAAGPLPVGRQAAAAGRPRAPGRRGRRRRAPAPRRRHGAASTTEPERLSRAASDRQREAGHHEGDADAPRSPWRARSPRRGWS